MECKYGLTPLEVAEILNISKNTVYEMAKRGEINSYRVGNKVRIDMQDIVDFKNRNKNIKNQAAFYNNFNTNSVTCRLEEMKRKYDFVICGEDVILNTLCRCLHNHPTKVHALNSYISCYNGLYDLYQGNVQIATAHMWDGDTGQYNVPYIKRLLPGVPVIIVHLVNRMQGFYVSEGNPKKIKGWDDLRRADISIINREKGSGTRILLDEYLRKLKIESSGVLGYERECFSHITVAATVAKGGADIAIGTEKVSHQIRGIEFIPLQTESYDLIMKKSDLHKPEFRAVLEILRSDEFKVEVENIGGYDLANLGKIIAET